MKRRVPAVASLDDLIIGDTLDPALQRVDRFDQDISQIISDRRSHYDLRLNQPFDSVWIAALTPGNKAAGIIYIYCGPCYS